LIFRFQFLLNYDRIQIGKSPGMNSFKNAPSSVHASRVSLITLTLMAGIATSFSQGPLTPPGPPAPLFKTLQQVEPRVPISSVPITLSQPGSYYLTTNLTGVAGQHGITINGPRVTVDLMGFELRGVPGSLSGIHMNPATSPQIRNGSITGWGQDGINGTNGGGGSIEDLRVSANGRWGISFNSGSQIRKCIASANGDVGIITSNDVEIDDCVAAGNGTHGIQAGTGSTIRRCLTVQNSAAGITGSGIDGLNIIECNSEFNGSGIATLGQTIVKDSFARSNRVAGIAVGPGSTVQGCNASDNGTNGISVDFGSTVQSCIAENNRGHGIVARNGSSIINCSARLNAFDSIQVDGDCIAANNSCDNATGLQGVGIHALSGDNRIENNNLTDNRAGLRIDGSGNYVANNSVRNNVTNYVIVTGNQLNILLSQLPQYVPWPATIKLAGTLTGIRNTNGITIASDDVTIDLNDHALVGVVQALDGIRVEGLHTNITVRNGSVLSWPGDGVDAANAVNSQLRNLNAARNNAVGLRVGEGSLLQSCTARSNVLDGIATGNGCRVIDCTTSRNGSEGIIVGTGGTVQGSTAFENTANGIFANAGSSVLNCSVYSNGTNGIYVSTGGQALNCTARGNSGNGIQASSASYVAQNTCSANVFAGILVSGVAARIDGNHCIGSQRGFHITGTDNLIIRNSTQGASVLAYDTAVGNHQAALIVSPGVGFASANAWANFSF
jgi:parallel beta-helix repeat protein